MDIGILGTGRVAQTLGARWAEAGHAITYGSRAPASAGGLDAPVVPSRAAVTDNEVVVNATPGAASLPLVEQIGADLFAGRILLDVANATTPAFELVYPNSSLGERLQAALPEAKVVKTLNTASMAVLSAPQSLPASSVFLSGEDPGAKSTAASLLADFGWSADSIVDLGGIVSARGTEHYFLLFAALRQSLGTAQFNIHVVR
jgi:8-hydroxy-5-deazaflavin:NADPH oxidoreductase